jgi:hypothetical protein
MCQPLSEARVVLYTRNRACRAGQLPAPGHRVHAGRAGRGGSRTPSGSTSAPPITFLVWRPR